ncbi:MAG TPA: hypothetical protein VNJ02_12890 [Vicinamibacterales bacterium]|nr:hypothetical protein [Vicinamibacterales bacterium]
MRRAVRAVVVLLVLFLVFAAGWLVAKAGLGQGFDPTTLPQVERAFIDKMRGAAMVGQFTTAGRDDRDATPDRYDIYSVDKIGDDQWRFNARIGETGVTLPVVVTMKFVDDTPFILLTNATLPGMGAFTARVFFYGDYYAGTWAHVGSAGGHMYGRVERAAAQR